MRADICIFGASGFTGAWITVATARAIASRAGDSAPVTLAIAGRDRTKLELVIERVRNETNFVDDITIVLADVSRPESLIEMARNARVVVSAVGPFRFLGEAVVVACIRGGAHYLDISGEPEFIEAIELRWSAAAAAASVSIVSSCGLDSVPADVGLSFAASTMRNAGYMPTAAESYITVSGGKHVSGNHACSAIATLNACRLFYAPTSSTQTSSCANAGSEISLRHIRKRCSWIRSYRRIATCTP